MEDIHSQSLHSPRPDPNHWIMDLGSSGVASWSAGRWRLEVGSLGNREEHTIAEVDRARNSRERPESTPNMFESASETKAMFHRGARDPARSQKKRFNAHIAHWAEHRTVDLCIIVLLHDLKTCAR